MAAFEERAAVEVAAAMMVDPKAAMSTRNCLLEKLTTMPRCLRTSLFSVLKYETSSLCFQFSIGANFDGFCSIWYRG